MNWIRNIWCQLTWIPILAIRKEDLQKLIPGNKYVVFREIRVTSTGRALPGKTHIQKFSKKDLDDYNNKHL